MDWEIILIDNASTDGTQNIIAERYPYIKLIRNTENYGFAKANNIGILHSSGKYLCFVNSDIEIKERCFEKLYIYMESHLDIGMAGPKIIGRDKKVQRSCMEFPTLWNIFCRTFALDIPFQRSKKFGGQMMTYWPHDTERDVDVINGCFWIVRREALEHVGLLDEIFFIYAEDIDWCHRFHDSGWRVVFAPHTEAVHYGGGSSEKAPIRFYLEMQRANYKYWKKYYSMKSCFFYLILRILHEAFRLAGHAVKAAIQPSRREIILEKVRRSWAGIRWATHEILTPRDLFRTNSSKETV